MRMLAVECECGALWEHQGLYVQHCKYSVQWYLSGYSDWDVRKSVIDSSLHGFLITWISYGKVVVHCAPVHRQSIISMHGSLTLVQQLNDMQLQHYHLVPVDILRHQLCRKHASDWSSQPADSPVKNWTILSWSSVWILFFHWLLEVEVAVSNESEPMRLCN